MSIRHAVTAALALILLASVSYAATVAREEAVPKDKDGVVVPKEVPGSEVTERVVVDPDHWGDWHDLNDSYYHYQPGGLRIDTWVDRGEYATYEPGDRLWVYFRVNRPCYVTILDYTTDGRVETIYPNRWSGSAKAYPGRVYRVPDDGRFSLRIAGPGGIETLVACAHELPWPSGSSGWWVPEYHPWVEPHGMVVPGGRPHGYVSPGRPGGRVVPGGRSSGRVVPGGSGGVVIEGGSSRWSPEGRWSSRWWRPPGVRIVVGPSWWPVPDRWRDSPGRWACDAVTFRVDDRSYGGWGDDWWRGGGWESDEWDGEQWDGDWEDDSWHGSWDGQGYGRPIMQEKFRMSTPKDSMHETFRFDGEKVHVKIDCVASRKNDPTEIVGRIGWFGGWGDETIFYIDASGREGVVPRLGDVYTAFTGPIRVDVEVIDLRMARVRPWQLPRIEWIKFDVKVYGA